MYRLEVTPAADRDLERLKKRIQKHNFERLRVVIRSLADESRPHGVKNEGSERAYRIRVGNYRVVYEIDDEEKLVLILQLARRTETTYRS